MITHLITIAEAIDAAVAVTGANRDALAEGYRGHAEIDARAVASDILWHHRRMSTPEIARAPGLGWSPKAHSAVQAAMRRCDRKEDLNRLRCEAVAWLVERGRLEATT